MDNQPPQSPAPEQPAQVPQPAMPPQQPVGPQPAAMPQPAPAPYNPVQPAKSSKKLWLGLGLGLGLFVLLIGFFVAWLFLWSPAAQAARLSGSFMHKITTGDVAGAVSLTGDATSKDFLTSASQKVQGSYSLQQFKYQNGTGYALYNLNAASEKYGRVIVAKQNGKFAVTSFVYSKDQLALVPTHTPTSTSTTENTAAPKTAASTAGCLVASDFAPFTNVSQGNPDPNGDGTFTAFFQLEFNPDATTYAPGLGLDPTTVFNDFKAFYAQSASKKYAIQLEASVNSATPDDALANARNAKVQSDLEKISGIPASKITIQPNTHDTSGTSGDSFYRQVQISLVSDESCSSYAQNP